MKKFNNFASNINQYYIKVMNKGPISQFITHHYRHFNSAALVDAAKGYEEHLKNDVGYGWSNEYS